MSLTRQQVTLLGIFALFLAPLLLVLIMRSPWWDFQPEGLRNQGHLVQPPVQLSVDTKVEGKWLLLYVISSNCEQSCIDDIISLRQIHKITGRQGKHLQILVLNTTGTNPELKQQVESVYMEISYMDSPSSELLASIQRVNAGLAAAGSGQPEAHTYILDPSQNVILAYTDDAKPNDISKDLKRLLNWSKVNNTP